MISEFSCLVGVPAEVILGRSREHRAVDARHLYWKLLRRKTSYTMQEIGMMNNRCHSAITHGVMSIDRLLDSGDKRVCEIWEKVKDLRF